MIEGLALAFEYHDGRLFRKNKARNGAKANQEAGSLIKSTGRWCINFNKKKLLRSRVVWMLHYGEIPSGMEVDHIDHDRLNDRIENLRLVTRKVNAKNLSKRRDNSSGVTGVTYCKRDNLWQAKINVDGKCVSLGHFRDMQSAIVARAEAEKTLGFHENHGK